MKGHTNAARGAKQARHLVSGSMWLKADVILHKDNAQIATAASTGFRVKASDHTIKRDHECVSNSPIRAHSAAYSQYYTAQVS